jgi:hypothetical protein
MGKWPKPMLGSLIVVALVTVLWSVLLSGPPDPVHKGKRLSVWLEGYGFSGQYIPALGLVPLRPIAKVSEWQAADEAVHEAGDKGIPLLIQFLRARDSSLKTKVMLLAQKQSFILVRYTPAADLNLRAAWAFEALGASASNAVPALVQIYEANYSQSSQCAAIRGLAVMGPAAQASIPCLLNATTNRDSQIRHAAWLALGQIHSRPEVVVPRLEAALNSGDPSVRSVAVSALGRFGPDAKSALPVLMELLRDKDIYLSLMAQKALEAISPQNGPFNTSLE